MSASDYGYASSGCYGGSQTLVNYNNSACASTNWLRKISEWTITPHTLYSRSVFGAHYTGTVGTTYFSGVTGATAVRPSLYLKSNVYMTGGTGTSTDPYTISQ